MKMSTKTYNIEVTNDTIDKFNNYEISNDKYRLKVTNIDKDYIELDLNLLNTNDTHSLSGSALIRQLTNDIYIYNTDLLVDNIINGSFISDIVDIKTAKTIVSRIIELELFKQKIIESIKRRDVNE
jgi:hypothetical protein